MSEVSFPGGSGSAGPIPDPDRAKAVEYLAATLQRFDAATSGLNAGQCAFRLDPNRWSICECVEHLVLVEQSVLARLEEVLKLPPESMQEDPARMDGRVLRAVPSRGRRVAAPEPVTPTGRFGEFEETAQAFREIRRRSIEFASTTPAELRSHFSPHLVLGMLDAHQWLLFLAAHTERHLEQIDEIKADAGFPRG